MTHDASCVANTSASQGPFSAGAYSFTAHSIVYFNSPAPHSPTQSPYTRSSDLTALTEIHDASHTPVVTVPAGTTVHDKATVSGSFGTPTGTVTFTFFTADRKSTRLNSRH